MNSAVAALVLPSADDHRGNSRSRPEQPLRSRRPKIATTPGKLLAPARRRRVRYTQSTSPGLLPASTPAHSRSHRPLPDTATASPTSASMASSSQTAAQHQIWSTDSRNCEKRRRCIRLASTVGSDQSWTSSSNPTCPRSMTGSRTCCAGKTRAAEVEMASRT